MQADIELEAHRRWLGFLQPQGLVVSPIAMHQAQWVVPRMASADQEAFAALLVSSQDSRGEKRLGIGTHAWDIFQWLGWQAQGVAGAPGGPALSPGLEVVLPEYAETLSPDWVVLNPRSQTGAPEPLLLVKILPGLEDLDILAEDDGRHWHATPQAKLERLMRETGVPIGLLAGETQIRLIYAPRGESSGSLTFPLGALVQPINRTILSAFRLILSWSRFAFGPSQPDSLPKVLEESRKYQAQVTSKLADQVLAGLYEWMRGFQSANQRAQGALLDAVLREEPDLVYSGLLTVMLRLIFILFAEERGLLPRHRIFVRHYSLIALHARLRSDYARNPDTMDHRFGAYAHLLTLFRLLFDGHERPDCPLPRRHGDLFNPDRYPFLEGRPPGVHRSLGERFDAPLVPDGTVFRVLDNLLILDGERLSYRTLDVEQLGAVYETMMGFRVEIAQGNTLGIRTKNAKRRGADIMVNLDTLLGLPAKERAKQFKAWTDRDLPAKKKAEVEKAGDLTALVEALRGIASPFTPVAQAAGSLLLQPTEERRKTGSHYTPRSMTEPIVDRALKPLLEAMGTDPSPEQILALKVCDPAMGSGAFLVAVCRYLADTLVESRKRRHETVALPADEDEVIFARRQVAQRVLYGVDRNAFAVELAKLSLWLATLARDHAFTFLDHSLRHGDSLLGLSLDQIRRLDWLAQGTENLSTEFYIAPKMALAKRMREQIAQAPDSESEGVLRNWMRTAEEELRDLRSIGDAVIHAYFGAEKPKAKRAQLLGAQARIQTWLDGDRTTPLRVEETADKGAEAHPLVPFHWELEFPEVFAAGGFSCILGNPPFAGKNTITAGNGPLYLDWLLDAHEPAHGNADLVAHFYRRAHTLLRPGGTFGFISTNSAFQGDTRATGLGYLVQHGVTLYYAQKRYKWQGAAAVVVCIVQGIKGSWAGQCVLDGRGVDRITSFLFHTGSDIMPQRLPSNEGQSFQGSIILGMGFTFDDTNPEEATPLAEMHRLIAKDPRNGELIFPYIGGEEVNKDPEHKHHRYVINFGERSLDEARNWPDLLAIVEEKVRPSRMLDNRKVRRDYWWRFAERTPALFEATQTLRQVLACSRVSTFHAFTFLDTKMVFSERLVIIANDSFSFFALLQSNIHETWSRFFGSTLEDRLLYTPSDCFQTFPFPVAYRDMNSLQIVGKHYFELRAEVMRGKNQGLTDTYNYFHDPACADTDIQSLRAAHAAMDAAVLAAYGWTDLALTYEFILDYTEDEDDTEAGESGRPSTKKKPYRYRLPDILQDEILGRLLALNQQQAREQGVLLSTTLPSPADSADLEDAKPKQALQKPGGKGKQQKSVVDLPLFQ
jgi:hypothetical protein